MKYEAVCNICAKESLLNSESRESGDVQFSDKAVFEVQFEDQKIIDVICLVGHKFKFLFTQEKFELLITSALSGLKDGYLREAFASTASALERFYEFVIRVILNSDQIEKSLIDQTWAKVSKQSERQLGAYLFLFLLATKVEAPTLPDKMVQMRNKVIHQGAFPKRNDAITFINEALDIIYRTLAILLLKHRDAVQAIFNESQNFNNEAKQIINTNWVENSMTCFVKNFLIGNEQACLQLITDDLNGSVSNKDFKEVIVFVWGTMDE